MADFKRAKIESKMYDVTSMDHYIKWRDSFIQNQTAIEDPDIGLILPVVNQFDNGPGVYNKPNSPFVYYKMPEDEETYKEETTIINFGDASSMKDLINKQDMIKGMERSILESPDNIFTPKISPDDSPEMAAIKKAVIHKNIDIDKYEQRFGSNYQNDKRLFNKPSISLPMTKRICNNLDITAVLILKDKSPDVPNPMGVEIVVELTGGEENE